MNQQALQDEYDEIKIKIILTQFAELEGKKLLEENEELNKDSFYLPSEKAKKRFIKGVNRYFLVHRIRKVARVLFQIRYPKLAVIIPVIIILLLTTFFSVEALRVRILNLIIHVENEYTEIRFGEDLQEKTEPQFKIEWDNAYVPTRVPKGYKIANITEHQTMKMIEYVNDNDKGYILFQQNSDKGGMNIDTEDADEWDTTTIQGEDGLVIRENNRVTVVWQKQDQMFLIIGESSSLTKNELINMAESVKLNQ
nr:DUF4367 domain-containing protein [Cohnella sp. REN36]